MFQTKRNPIRVHTRASVPVNGFLAAAAAIPSTALSNNGAVKYEDALDPFVMQMKSAGTYLKPRTFDQVTKDVTLLNASNTMDMIKMSFYLRAVTRLTNVGTEKYQVTGEGLKNEGIFRMLWLGVYMPNKFLENLLLWTKIGSWADVFRMLELDIAYNGWEGKQLPWDGIFEVIKEGLADTRVIDLVKKYLPQIKAESKCKTIEAQSSNVVAKWLCAKMFGAKGESLSHSYMQYRKFKTSGTAHQWQQHISRRDYQAIDFAKVGGRALTTLVKSKTFLTKSGLREKYGAWIGNKAAKGLSVNYTGFIHELLAPLESSSSIAPAEKNTIAAQCQRLVEESGPAMESFQYIVVRDTSGSMGNIVRQAKCSAGHIAKSMGLMLSEFCKGTFSDHYIEFADKATLRQYKGTNVVDRYINDRHSFIGSTEFSSVVDLLCKMRQDGVPESEFPKGILCLSDGEFNRVGNKTNFELLEHKMSAHFSEDFMSQFKVVFWDIISNHDGNVRSETYGSRKNVFYFGGFSPSVIKFIIGAKTTDDVVTNALNQEWLNLIK